MYQRVGRARLRRGCPGRETLQGGSGMKMLRTLGLLLLLIVTAWPLGCSSEPAREGRPKPQETPARGSRY